MMSFFKSLGFDITFIAGIAGAIASLTKQKGISRKEQIIIVLSGGFTANYLTPLTAEWLNFSDNFSDKILYGIAFLLGYSGMKAVETLIKSTHKKISDDNDEQKQ